MSKTKSVYAKDSSLQARNAKHQSFSQGKQGKNVKQINNGKKTSSIRPSLSIGTIAILVAGPYKGKRVVVVKHLDSGNIAVTGPYHVNGVPLRRVNPAFVIATSTKLCNVGIETYDLNDTYFNKIKTKKTQKPKESEDVFMSQGENNTTKVLPQEKIEFQKKIDAPLVKYLDLSENALLKQYLKTRFTLRDKMYPHALKF